MLFVIVCAGEFSFLRSFHISGHLCCLLYIFACCFIIYNILVAFVAPAGRETYWKTDRHMFTLVCQSKGMWDMPYVCIYNKSATRNDSKYLSLDVCACVCVALNYEHACFERTSPSLPCLAINVRRIFLSIKATIFSWKLHILWRRASKLFFPRCCYLFMWLL